MTRKLFFFHPESFDKLIYQGGQPQKDYGKMKYSRFSKSKKFKIPSRIIIAFFEQNSENGKFCFVHYTILWVLQLCVICFKQEYLTIV